LIDLLTGLARQTAALRQYSELCGDPVLRSIGVDFARAMTKAVDDLAQEPSALVGEMPWWAASRTDKRLRIDEHVGTRDVTSAQTTATA
jgi:hypothetical protein